MFLIICINHLNIIDALININDRYKKEFIHCSKKIPAGDETEKENAKEKFEDQEKFLSSNNHLSGNFHLSGKDLFISYCTALNIHPHGEKDTQPPKVI